MYNQTVLGIENPAVRQPSESDRRPHGSSCTSVWLRPKRKSGPGKRTSKVVSIVIVRDLCAQYTTIVRSCFTRAGPAIPSWATSAYHRFPAPRSPFQLFMHRRRTARDENERCSRVRRFASAWHVRRGYFQARPRRSWRNARRAGVDAPKAAWLLGVAPLPAPLPCKRQMTLHEGKHLSSIARRNGSLFVGALQARLLRNTGQPILIP
jgi:hypothetical protein